MLIPKYTFTAIELNGAENYPALPLKYNDSLDMCYCLDAITAAVEAGKVDSTTWPSTLFATRKDFEGFIDGFRYYGEERRINDRWHQALGAMVGWYDDEGFITADEIADKLVERVQDIDEKAAQAKPATKKKLQ